MLAVQDASPNRNHAKLQMCEAPGYGDGVEYWNKRPGHHKPATSRGNRSCGRMNLARYRGDPNPFEWLESFTELESLIKEAQGFAHLRRLSGTAICVSTSLVV